MMNYFVKRLYIMEQLIKELFERIEALEKRVEKIEEESGLTPALSKGRGGSRHR